MTAVSFLPPDTLAALRAVSDQALDALADVYRPTTSRGTGAVSTVAYPATADPTGIPCRLSPAGAPQEQLTADAVRLDARVVLVFPANADVETNDRLVVTGTMAGVPYTATIRLDGVSVPRSNAIATKATGTVETWT